MGMFVSDSVHPARDYRELFCNTWMAKAVRLSCPVLPTRGTAMCNTGKSGFMGELLVKSMQECYFQDFSAAGIIDAKLKLLLFVPSQ